MQTLEIKLKMALLSQRWTLFKKWLRDDEFINGNLSPLFDHDRERVMEEAIQSADTRGLRNTGKDGFGAYQYGDNVFNVLTVCERASERKDASRAGMDDRLRANGSRNAKSTDQAHLSIQRLILKLSGLVCSLSTLLNPICASVREPEAFDTGSSKTTATRRPFILQNW